MSAPSAAARPPLRRNVWFLSIAVWSTVGVGVALQIVAARTLVGGEASLATELGRVLREYLVWAALCPGVLALAARFPLVRPARLRNALIHLAAAAGFTVVQVAAFGAMHLLAAGVQPWIGPGPYLMVALQYVPYDLVLYGTVVAVHHAVAFHRAYVSRAVLDAQLEARLSRAELDALQSHLQPRFLFQTLDAISVRLAGDPAGARRSVADLSELLRWSMQIDDVEVPLHRELELLDQYASLRRLHFAGGMRLEVEAGEAVREALVPRLLFQPFVEAALPDDGDGAPSGLAVRAWTEGPSLCLSLVQAPSGGPSETRVLDDARDRLSRLYGDEGRVEARSGDGAWEVRLRVPFREA